MARVRRNLPSYEKRQWIILLGLFGALALGLIVMLVVRTGPSFSWKAIAFWDTGGDSDATRQLYEESLALEEQFKGRIFVQAPTEEDLRPLVLSIRKMREYLERTKVNDVRNLQRLEQLETALAEARSTGIQQRSERAEQLARERIAANELPAAITALREARDLQSELNSGRAPKWRNTSREASLSREIENLEARPLLEKSLAAEERAKALVAEQKWTEALAAYTEARDAQLELNRSFSRSTAASTSRYNALDVEVASFATGTLISEIEGLLGQAESAMGAGDAGRAAVLYRSALQRQIQINNEFPRSRFAGQQRVEELRVTIETVESFDLANALKGADQEIQRLLRGRQVELARQALDRAAVSLETFQTRFRRSTLLDEDARYRLTYLHRIQGSLSAIQDAVLARVLPIPGSPGWDMLTTEVPQSLYQRVMLENPSRNQGDDLPVESISWDEAVRFARQLSWALGLPARLPTLAEFRAAVGTYDPDRLADGAAWINETSEGATRPVGTSPPNPAGFQDLLGNVSEWLGDDGGTSASATHAGGSYTDRTGAFVELPTGSRGRIDRARTIGLRVVITSPSATAVETR